MNATKIALFAGAAVIVAGGLFVALRMNPSASNQQGQGAIGAPVQPSNQARELSPYTNVVSIPASVDPSTIRFEKLALVDLASRTKTTTDLQRCKELQFKDPDGSGCQTTQVEERVKAVEARYSYNGPEITSGESVPGRDSFSVYFKPEEVAVDGPVTKLKRDQAAAMFQVTTYRPTVEQKVVDKQHSQYCGGNYVDGSWVKSDANCQDKLTFTTQTVPSASLMVQVDVRQPSTVASR